MKHLFTLAFLLIVINVFSQSAGDTIIVESFNYTQTHGWPWSGMIRDTMIDFPDDPGITYEKVIMLYNMRCKNGLVSTTSDRNKGCGEWDYSCNTYITDSSRVDSVLNYTSSHYISGFSGETFSYVETPVYDYFQYRQKDVQIDETNSETLYDVEDDDLSLLHVFLTNKQSGRSQFIYQADELTSAGLTTGDIDALLFEIDDSNNANADYLKLRLKQTTKTQLSSADPDLDGFTEVYFQDYIFAAGSNRMQFHTPFNWDGTSNIIVEFSFTNHNTSDQTLVAGSNAGFDCGIFTFDGYSLESVNGKIELPADPMASISEAITISFWSYGNEKIQPVHNSIFHAADGEGNKTANVHLPWGNSNIYWDCGNVGSSYDRINKGATANEYEGNWSHWAFTKDTTSGDMKIYHNGELWHSGTDKKRLIDIQQFLLGTSGSYSRSYFGKMDEIRIWDTELSEETINDWMHRSVDNSHPNHENLVAYYRLNEGSGSTIEDDSDFNEMANIDGYMYWAYDRGDALNRDFQQTQVRPKLWFAQGDYDLTITDQIVTDSVANIPNIVREYEIIPRYGTMLDDSINQISVNEYWEAQYQHIYDPEGELIDSVEVTATDEIEIGELVYFRRYPAKYEIMSFVTPYGINLDLGMEGKTWVVDVTDYLPILSGTKRMTVERGGQWQEDMDIKFLFIVGTPPRDVIDINQLWRPDSKSFSAIMDDRAFEPRDVPMNPDGEFFEIRTVITGHGQQGEFIGRNHFIEIDGNEEFNWKIWTECSTNPIYPQGGTWIYDRAGWCPGQSSDLKVNDITDLVTPGVISNIDYGLVVASGTSNYIVNNQLVTYGGANFELDAAITEVLKPNSLDAKNDRFNPACTYPEIVIQNTGSSTLYTLDIEYYEVGGEAETYKWTGVLEFLDTAKVVLPINDLSFWMPTTNQFEVNISNPNNEEDEYSYNNTFRTNFEGVDIYDDTQMYLIELKTNNRGYETSMALTDADGNILKEWDDLNNNQTYTYPMNLDPGCYKLRIDDSADDGLYWWHSSTQGTGYLRIKTAQAVTLYTFESEFGRFAEYEFGMGAITSVDNISKETFVSVYPNPAENYLHIDILGLENEQVTLRLSNAMMATVLEQSSQLGSSDFSTDLNISHLPAGIYLLQVEYGGAAVVKKIVKR